MFVVNVLAENKKMEQKHYFLIDHSVFQKCHAVAQIYCPNLLAVPLDTLHDVRYPTMLLRYHFVSFCRSSFYLNICTEIESLCIWCLHIKPTK